jgi:hypothetical protein
MKILGNFVNNGTIVDIHDNEQVMVTPQGIQSCTDKGEAAPEEDVIPTSSEEEEVKPASGRGRRKQHLFMKGDIKDEETTARMAALFTGYLKSHHCESGRRMETRNENYIAKAFVAFYDYWKSEGCVDSFVNGGACYRFLNIDCALPCVVTERAYQNWIKGRVEQGATDIEMESNVAEYMKNN